MKNKRLKQWSAFIDIMGFSALNREIKCKEEAEDLFLLMEKLKETNENLNKVFKEIDNQNNSDFSNYYEEINTAFVSDSIFITIQPKKNSSCLNQDQINYFNQISLNRLLFRIESIFYEIFKGKELIIRGGISDKFAKINDNHTFIVGNALTESATLEKGAEYPRIILSKTISDDTELMKSINQDNRFLKDDIDHFYYTDFLRHLTKDDIFKDLKEFVEQKIKEYKNNHKLLKKYLWLERYIKLKESS